MKLIYIANARIPTEKAHGLQTMKTCEALARQGVEVRLVVPRRTNAIAADPFAYYSIERLFRITRCPTLDLVRFGVLGFWIQRITFYLAALPHVAAAHAEVVYSRDLFISFMFSLSGHPVVYEDHEPIRNRMLYAFALRRIPYKIVVAQNLVTLYESLRIPTDRISVAPNGVDLKEFKQIPSDRELWKVYGIPESKKVVLYVGHFYRWKGIHTLLDAAREIGNDVVIVCVGGTADDSAALGRHVAERNLTNICLVPFMKHQDVVRHMKSADVLVLPNTAAEERSLRYTTPLKLFEYMASGVPIVASRIPSIELYLTDRVTGKLVTPDAPIELARGIADVLANPTEAARLARAALREVERYTWERRAASIRLFLTSVYREPAA